MKSRNYPKGIRERALQLLSEGKRVKDVAAEVKASPAAVSYWKKKASNGAAVEETPAKKKAKPPSDPRITLALHCLREARRLIESAGGRSSKVELYSLLALKWLEGE